MKVLKLSCRQFAGVRNSEVSLGEGINVIFGQNESGKTTMVNLMASTMFQKSKVRSNSGFRAQFIPQELGFAEGAVSIEADGGQEYTVRRIWASDRTASSELAIPSGGTIRDETEIENLLSPVLKYNEGVYRQVLLASQRNQEENLRALLAGESGDLAVALTKAFNESSGPSIDEISKLISGKIKQLSDRWDAVQMRPENSSRRYKNGVGDVLQACYDVEDTQKELDEIKALEDHAGQTEEEYRKAEKAFRDAEAALEGFRKWMDQLLRRSFLKKEVELTAKELNQMCRESAEWEQEKTEFEKCSALQKEYHSRVILDIFDQVSKLDGQLQETEEQLKRFGDLNRDGVKRAYDLSRSIQDAGQKLGGLNLQIQTVMESGYEVHIRSAADSRELTGEALRHVEEAVTVQVPGVMEMQLSQADIDLEQVKKKLDEDRKALDDILRKYGVSTAEELEDLLGERGSLEEKAADLKRQMKDALTGMSREQLNSEVSKVTGTVRSRAEIEADISSYCRPDKISTRVDVLTDRLQKHADSWDSLDVLKRSIEEKEEKLTSVREALDEAADSIPAEYRDIRNPDACEKELKETRGRRENERTEALKQNTAAVTRLDDAQEDSMNLRTELAEKKQRFEQLKKDLQRWLDIQEVFNRLVQKMRQNPLKDLALQFQKNLSMLTGESIRSDFSDYERLNFQLSHDGTPLDFDKLSEGTKDAVYLAFRLAVVDHLFPDGGGVVVLDDPFTDMDLERRDRACELVKDFAARHQVIFLTCREEYAELLGGNEIKLD